MQKQHKISQGRSADDKMKSIIDNLKKFGAVTEGDFYSKVGSADLYISCLDAFSLDDRFDKLCACIASQDYPFALKTAHSLLDSAQKLDLIPLTELCEKLCAALEIGSPNAIESALASYKEKFAQFRNALSCG